MSQPKKIIITDEVLPITEQDISEKIECKSCLSYQKASGFRTFCYREHADEVCSMCLSELKQSYANVPHTILEKSQESGQKLKDALLQAEQDKIALQLRIIKLESDLAEQKDKDYASYRSMAKYCMAKDDELNELAQKCLAERKAKTSVELKLKCVEGERDRYKEERDKAEKEVERLTMLMEDMERGFSSDE